MSTSDKIPSVDSSSLLPPPRKDYEKQSLPNRGTYTPTNAERFRAIFDEMLVDNKPKEIHSSAAGLKTSTLYIKANDALKWLAECDPKRGQDYSNLRSRVSITKTDRGILIYFKASIRQIITASTADVNKGWKEELTDWLTNAQPGDLFEKKDILVSPEDNVWLLRLLSGLAGESAELEVGENSVRIMR